MRWRGQTGGSEPPLAFPVTFAPGRFAINHGFPHGAKMLPETHKDARNSDNQSVVKPNDVIFLVLMAEAAPDVLGSLIFREGQIAITFIAGLSLAEADVLVRLSRATVIMMPFTGIAHGGTSIMMY